MAGLTISEESFVAFVHRLIPPWVSRAACRDEDPSLFFPGQHASSLEMHRARLICERCDVQAECLGYALSNNEHFGIWGGKSERERKRIKRKAA